MAHTDWHEQSAAVLTRASHFRQWSCSPHPQTCQINHYFISFILIQMFVVHRLPQPMGTAWMLQEESICPQECVHCSGAQGAGECRAPSTGGHKERDQRQAAHLPRMLHSMGRVTLTAQLLKGRENLTGISWQNKREGMTVDSSISAGMEVPFSSLCHSQTQYKTSLK